MDVVDTKLFEIIQDSVDYNIDKHQWYAVVYIKYLNLRKLRISKINSRRLEDTDNREKLSKVWFFSKQGRIPNKGRPKALLAEAEGFEFNQNQTYCLVPLIVGHLYSLLLRRRQ